MSRAPASTAHAANSAKHARAEPSSSTDPSRRAGPKGAEQRGAEPKGTEPKVPEPKGAEPKGAEPKGAEPKGAEPDGREPKGGEPDARFTFANERTFLAWSRTALALVVAGLAIAQLLPPFPGVPLGRHLLAVPLIVLGAALSVIAYIEWGRNQRALRRGQPLPRSPLPRILATVIAAMAVAAAVIVLLSAALK